jgi:CHAT domain-containing protein
MNNQLIIKGLCFFFIFLFIEKKVALGQHSAQDSILAKTEIDSLLKICVRLASEQKRAESIQINLLAQQKAIDFFGKKHVIFAETLQKLGMNLNYFGNGREAEPYLLEALSIFEASEGKLHVSYTYNLGLLGSAYFHQGKYLEAENCLLEVQKLSEQLPPTEKMDILPFLNVLANLYSMMNQFEKAEKASLEIKKRLETAGRTEELSYFVCLNNLADIYLCIGQYEKANQLSLLSIDFFEKTNQKNTGSYAFSVRQLGLGYYYLKEYEKAEPLYLEAKNIYKNILGEDNQDYAGMLGCLGSLYLKLEQYSKAEINFLEAKRLEENAGIACSQCYLSTLSQLGKINLITKKYDAAIDYAQTTLRFLEKKMGKEQDDYLINQLLLAKIYYFSKQFSEATNQLLLCSALEKKLLRRASTHFSQDEIVQYLPRIAQTENWLGTLAQVQNLELDALNAAFFDAVLFRKGYFLQSSQTINQLVEAADSDTKLLFSDWKNCQDQLASIYSAPISARKNVDSLENQAVFLEKSLVQRIAGFSESQKDIFWNDVKSVLKPTESAIEFVNFKDMNDDKSGKIIYAALVVLPNSKSPKFVPLFEESELTNLTNRSKSWLQDYVQNLYKNQQPEGQKSLHELIWQPIETALAGSETPVKTIYFSPNGQLHRLNLAVIERPNLRPLSEKYNFVELGSTRQLVVKSAQILDKNNRTALVFGGVQYEMDSAAIRAANVNLSIADRAEIGRGLDFESADSTLRGGSWKYLPATEKEAQLIENQLVSAGFKTEKRTGFAASEEAFKVICSGKNSVKSPHILHLATHGFFFPDPSTSPKSGEIAFKVSANPMIRSGIVLAGANQVWKSGQPKKDLEDGILTAYEISQLNLSNTELVVLSACETGLGDIAGNEGVYGLQRAFKIAGARHLLMSLWKVDDEKTAEMMAIFYEKWLGKEVGEDANNGHLEKMEIPDAFRAAQNLMRTKYPNPFYWAGFVLVK